MSEHKMYSTLFSSESVSAAFTRCRRRPHCSRASPTAWRKCSQFWREGERGGEREGERYSYYDTTTTTTTNNNNNNNSNSNNNNNTNNMTTNKHVFGWHYLSNATCLTRPRLFHALIIVSIIIILLFFEEHLR